jgi:hypothetical protein
MIRWDPGLYSFTLRANPESCAGVFPVDPFPVDVDFVQEKKMMADNKIKRKIFIVWNY